MRKKPNIILMITHDQGLFLGCYNFSQTPNSLNTPYLDKLAENGVKFTNYFCTAPQCSPSRGGIYTSRYPHQNGLMGLVNKGWTLPTNNTTLAMYLKKGGYTTHLLGLQHESLDATTLGYDTISKRGAEFKYSCKRMEDTYLKFLSEHKNDSKPFYLNIGTIEAHRPFRAWADPVNPNNVKIPPFLPDNDIIRQDFADFYGVINSVDSTVGKILEYLEETHLIENTLFIFTTDHGIPFPRAKCTLYDPGIKTLLLMSWPSSDLFSKRKVIDNLLSNIDLLPTLLGICEITIPKGIEGKNFLPILEGEKKEIRSEIFAEKTYHEVYDPIRTIRNNYYKYIRNFEKLDTLYEIPLDILKDPSGKYMKELYSTPRKPEEFYNLQKDPHELHNLIDSPAYQDIILEFKKKLLEWMRLTQDPLLKSKVKSQPQSNLEFHHY